MDQLEDQVARGPRLLQPDTEDLGSIVAAANAAHGVVVLEGEHAPGLESALELGGLLRDFVPRPLQFRDVDARATNAHHVAVIVELSL
jgi:hypothetical protein